MDVLATNNNQKVDNNNDQVHNTNHILELQYITPTEVTPVKQNNIIQESSDIRTLPEKSPSFKIISNVLLGNYLTLPKTPERKGKKNTTRFPFAVTSDKYKIMFKEQKKQKDLTIKLKEERKKTREQSKITKETKKGKNNEKKTESKKTKEKCTNSCRLCLTETKSCNRLVCDICSSIFHVKCVPTHHQQHVPEDIDIDLYICHNCYQVDNNDSMEIDFNEDNDDDDDDSQTDKIYAIYKDQKAMYI